MIKIKLSVAVEVNLDFYQLFRAGESKSLKAKNTMKRYTKSLWTWGVQEWVRVVIFVRKDLLFFLGSGFSVMKRIGNGVLEDVEGIIIQRVQCGHKDWVREDVYMTKRSVITETGFLVVIFCDSIPFRG